MVLLALVLSAGPGATSSEAGVPKGMGGVRPGPDILYANPPRAPQLENAGTWKAAPILVSGASAYREGEFIYQDFLFDDRGAAPALASPGAETFAPSAGRASYPSDPVFAGNAADLVELRVKPLKTATALRVTLNTLKDPKRTAFTVALGSSAQPVAWPHGAGVRSPAALFLTVHGDRAELLDAASGNAVGPGPTAAVDLERRQVNVRIPHAAWNPGSQVVRMAAGVGLWDPQAGSYLPLGSGARLFNLAFRFDEPVPDIDSVGAINTIAEGAAGAALDAAFWRERAQADALRAGDVSAFSAEVDFAKLRRKAGDESGVPASGYIDRIFASRYTLGDGVDHDVSCDASTAQLTGAAPTECTGNYLSQLQPYALYVPRKRMVPGGYGLVLALHAASSNYNQYLGSRMAEQLGERATPSIVATPEARGPSTGYASYAEADVFEVWADVARHYELNPAVTDITGYSMGGIGTFRLVSRYPDLFARGGPIVGPLPTTPFENLRHVPFMAWYGQNDELGGPELFEPVFAGALQAGIRYDHWVFTPAGHITLANNDEFRPLADFFGAHSVERNPARVTFTIDPRDAAKPTSVPDRAYWVSGLVPRSAEAKATIDVRSAGFGEGDPPVEPPAASAGTLNGGSHGPLPYHRRTITWGDTPATQKANRLKITATNVQSVSIDAKRARVGCDAALDVTSDGPLKVRLRGCGARARACLRPSAIAFRLHSPRSRVVRVVAYANGKRRLRRTGTDIRRIKLKGLKRRGKLTIRIVATHNTGSKIISTRTWKRCRKGKVRVRRVPRRG
jgi:hypothetical protein